MSPASSRGHPRCGPTVAWALALVVTGGLFLAAEVVPRPAVRSVMEAEQALRDVPLREVIHAATGHRVLRFGGKNGDAVDQAVFTHLTGACDALLAFLNGPTKPTQDLRRINEASGKAEDHLRVLLHRGDFECAVPTNAKGVAQRAGYPDLKIVHRPSQRTYYLDPKLFESTARTSTLRTFYYEPRALTGKIQGDACHLLLGVAHDGVDGRWRFTGWDLVDLYDFRVALKAEFHGSNKALYRDELIVGRSAPPP
jgi:hypothetical protein